MIIGYARVSTDKQDNALQLEELKRAKCENIFEEKASGGKLHRPELDRMLEQLRRGDVVVVWKLDRLSRSLHDLLIIIEKIGGAEASFRSVTEPFDTTTPAGVMMMQMVGVFAQFERSIIKERTLAGLKEARAKGRVGGRRPKLSQAQSEEVRRLVENGEKSEAEVARLFGVHRSTVNRIKKRIEHMVKTNG